MLILVLDEVDILLVHGEICKMDVLFGERLGIVRILLRSESNEPVVIDVDLQWVEACNEYIHSEIIFESVYQTEFGSTTEKRLNTCSCRSRYPTQPIYTTPWSIHARMLDSPWSRHLIRTSTCSGQAI